MAHTTKKNLLETMSGESGMTLLEIVIVVSIIAVLAAIAVPNFKVWLPNMRLKAAARDVYSDMQKAKMSAIKFNTTVTFNFNPGSGSPCEGGNYTFQDSEGKIISARTMKEGVCLSTPSNFPAGFLPNGLPAGSIGTVKLTHPKTSRYYEISQTIAGGIRLQ